VLGTPEQHLKLTGDVVFDQGLAAEREMLRMNLDHQELEELATKSQELLIAPSPWPWRDVSRRMRPN